MGEGGYLSSTPPLRGRAAPDGTVDLSRWSEAPTEARRTYEISYLTKETQSQSMKVGAVFCDYDGTLARMDTSRELSRVPDELVGTLTRIAAHVPVAIVTMKDFDFIQTRVPFAAGWACVGGLEVRLADGRIFRSRVRIQESILEDIQRRLPSGFTVETKRGADGELLGLCVDWRYGTAPHDDFIQALLRELRSRNLYVRYAPPEPFIDALAGRPDEGTAVRTLAQLLGVKGSLVYIGDSVSDNPAFDEADLGICILHGQELLPITSRAAVQQYELHPFLTSLLLNELEIPDDAWLFHRK